MPRCTSPRRSLGATASLARSGSSLSVFSTGLPRSCFRESRGSARRCCGRRVWSRLARRSGECSLTAVRRPRPCSPSPDSLSWSLRCSRTWPLSLCPCGGKRSKLRSCSLSLGRSQPMRGRSGSPSSTCSNYLHSRPRSWSRSMTCSGSTLPRPRSWRWRFGGCAMSEWGSWPPCGRNPTSHRRSTSTGCSQATG